MLKITVQIPEKRDRAGFVEIADGFKTLSEGVAVATSGFSDKGRGRDHPPLGRYELTARAATPGGAQTEYGAQVLLFEPIAGPALEAESYGRFGVLLYAGPTGSDSLLRRTQGGVRLARGAMEALLASVRDDAEVELSIEALPSVRWWAFWRRRRTPPPLSRDPPRLTQPPYDEATLAARMLQSAIRRSRATRHEEIDVDTNYDRSPEARSDFRGGGGSGGGGGASGSWTDAPAAGRGPGVNAAGVVLGAAGVAAMAAAAAAAAERESAANASQDPEPSSAPSDSGSSADAGSPADSNSSGDSNSGSSGTTTSTVY